MRRQVFLVWFIVFLCWTLYRAYFIFPEYIDELFVKPLFFVLPILYIVLVKEKKSLADLGLKPKPIDFSLDLYMGVLVGVLFALEGLLANYLKNGQFSFGQILAAKVSGGLLPFFFVTLATSLWEELLGRGYIYRRLNATTHRQFSAAFTSSFLFLLLHVPILFTRLHLTGTSLIVYPISILILGITNSYLYSFRGSLTLPVLVHAFWNMTVAFYL